ncbi:hypothetical protein D3C83_02720 [compost metagenome]
MHARGHQVVARAFRRRARQHRGFDVDEALPVEKVAHRHRRAVAQPQVLLHGRAAQVEHAVLEAHRFRQVVVVHLEHRRQRRVQYFDRLRQHFHFPALKVGIDRAHGPLAHLARHAQHEFAAQPVRGPESLRRIRVAHDLHQALAVPQVDEDNAAVIAAPVHPAEQGHFVPEMFAADPAAVFATHYWLTAFGGTATGRATVPFLRPLPPGETTPIEMMYLSASSTDMSSSITSLFGSIRKKPEVGLGVVGT